ncbi:MAG TPA: hypothetical protein VHI99_24595 [Vicinamibacterales bacterium]|jgi:hypothetical protein|nr:hypothetical protein [Vicinamibacterales bacterium]
MQDDTGNDHPSTDEHLGAVEGDRPGDSPQQGNPHGKGLDDQGLPDDPIAVCEDVIGANVDKTQG